MLNDSFIQFLDIREKRMRDTFEELEHIDWQCMCGPYGNV